MSGVPELVCPAGTPAALRAAVEAGADAVYVGFRDATNARNHPGLNFSRDELAEGRDFAHARGCKVYLAANTFPRASAAGPWRAAVDDGAALGVDAVIVADLGLLGYAARRYPHLRLHLSVQACPAHARALDYVRRHFGVRRAVLPRLFTMEEIASLAAVASVELEVFVYGIFYPMAEGRCALSTYATGCSPNTFGQCSPARQVRYADDNGELSVRVGGFTVNRFAKSEVAAYPTLCKGRFLTRGRPGYLFEDPQSLDAEALIPQLAAAGVTALKVEGRQRGRAYVAHAVGSLRRALDGGRPAAARAEGSRALLAEGRRTSIGAYRKGWR